MAACSCGDDGGSGDGSGGSSGTETETTVRPVTTDDSAGSSGFELLCLPGTQRCGDQVTVETCADTGLEWIPDPCGPQANCVQCDEPDCTTARCEGPCDRAADLPSSAGCAFIANRNLHLYEQWPDGVVLGNPNDEGTARVQIFFVPPGTRDEVPFEAMPELMLGPGEVSDGIPLDSDFLPSSTSFLRTGGIFRIYSDLPIIAYQHAPLQANLGNESSLLLPDEVLGNEYVVLSAPASVITGFYREPSYFTVIALEDDTEVSWTPRFSALNGNGLPIPLVETGETGTMTMNRYETLQVVPSENFVDKDSNPFAADGGWNLELDVSGTVIRADKPIWVLSASRDSMVPTGNFGTGDQLQEVVFPLQTWGREYVAPAPPIRDPETTPPEKGYWRIYAGSNDVTINAQPAHPDFPMTLSERGEFRDVVIDSGVDTFLSSDDGAFMPVGYLRSRIINQDVADTLGVARDIGKGDSAMVQMVPTEQFLRRYTFATGVGFTVNVVQVIRTEGGAAVELDGSNITGWQTVPGGYEVTTAPLNEGSHDISSADPFGIIQMGWTNSDLGNDPGCVRNEPIEVDGEMLNAAECNSSYAYPGGMKTEPIFVP